jgi:hypothetical protein
VFLVNRKAGALCGLWQDAHLEQTRTEEEKKKLDKEVLL